MQNERLETWLNYKDCFNFSVETTLGEIASFFERLP